MSPDQESIFNTSITPDKYDDFRRFVRGEGEDGSRRNWQGFHILSPYVNQTDKMLRELDNKNGIDLLQWVLDCLVYYPLDVLGGVAIDETSGHESEEKQENVKKHTPADQLEKSDQVSEIVELSEEFFCLIAEADAEFDRIMKKFPQYELDEAKISTIRKIFLEKKSIVIENFFKAFLNAAVKNMSGGERVFEIIEIKNQFKKMIQEIDTKSERSIKPEKDFLFLETTLSEKSFEKLFSLAGAIKCYTKNDNLGFLIQSIQKKKAEDNAIEINAQEVQQLVCFLSDQEIPEIKGALKKQKESVDKDFKKNIEPLDQQMASNNNWIAKLSWGFAALVVGAGILVAAFVTTALLWQIVVVAAAIALAAAIRLRIEALLKCTYNSPVQQQQASLTTAYNSRKGEIDLKVQQLEAISASLVSFRAKP